LRSYFSKLGLAFRPVVDGSLLVHASDHVRLSCGLF